MIRRLGLTFVFFAGIAAASAAMAVPIDSGACMYRCGERGGSLEDCKYICGVSK
jgi:hypothetical protein